MTKNQIEYNKLLETMRSNRASEVITRDRDAETGRHNLASEALTGRQIQVQSDFNSGSLDLRAKELAEKQRAAKAQESLTQQSIAAGVENNIRAAEATKYAAGASASASKYVADSTARNVSAQLEVQKSQNLMTNILNMSKVGLQKAQNTETRRSNVANEQLKAQQNAISDKIGTLNAAVNMMGIGMRGLSTAMMGGL